MKITYSKTNKYKTQIQRIIWSTLSSKKERRYIYIIAIIGACLLVSGLANGYDIKETNIVGDNEEVKLYNLHIFVGIGIALILYAITLINKYSKSKKHIQLALNSSFSKYASDFSYSFDANTVTFENQNTILINKWEYYSRYTNTDGFLVMFSKNRYEKTPVNIIPTDNFNPEQKKEIIDIFKSKIG